MKREVAAQQKILFVQVDPVKVQTYALVLKHPWINVISCGDYERAYRMIAKERPRLVICDIILPDDHLPNYVFINKVREINPEILVMILTRDYSIELITSCFKEGASGYLLYSTSLPEFVKATFEILEGGNPLCREVSSCLVGSYKLARENPLTRREQEVLRELTTGKSYKYIADSLNVSVDTVRTHVQRIFEKLEVHNKSEAVIKARTERLV